MSMKHFLTSEEFLEFLIRSLYGPFIDIWNPRYLRRQIGQISNGYAETA
jgi:hypothetical protein